jgi:hypothetical protein
VRPWGLRPAVRRFAPTSENPPSAPGPGHSGPAAVRECPVVRCGLAAVRERPVVRSGLAAVRGVGHVIRSCLALSAKVAWFAPTWPLCARGLVIRSNLTAVRERPVVRSDLGCCPRMPVVRSDLAAVRELPVVRSTWPLSRGLVVRSDLAALREVVRSDSLPGCLPGSDDARAAARIPAHSRGGPGQGRPGLGAGRALATRSLRTSSEVRSRHRPRGNVPIRSGP